MFIIVVFRNNLSIFFNSEEFFLEASFDPQLHRILARRLSEPLVEVNGALRALANLFNFLEVRLHFRKCDNAMTEEHVS